MGRGVVFCIAMKTLIALLFAVTLLGQSRPYPAREPRTITQGAVTLHYVKHWTLNPARPRYLEVCVQTINEETQVFNVTVTYQAGGKSHAMASRLQRVRSSAATCEVFWGDVAIGLTSIGVQEIAAPVEFDVSE
jgi:hypothetical protein